MWVSIVMAPPLPARPCPFVRRRSLVLRRLLLHRILRRRGLIPRRLLRGLVLRRLVRRCGLVLRRLVRRRGLVPLRRGRPGAR